MLQCGDDLTDEEPCLVLRETLLLLDQFEQVAARTMLKDQEKMALRLKALTQIHDALVLNRLLQDLLLELCVRQQLVFIKHFFAVNLDRISFPVSLIHTLEDLAQRALPDEISQLIVPDENRFGLRVFLSPFNHSLIPL